MQPCFWGAAVWVWLCIFPANWASGYQESASGTEAAQEGAKVYGQLTIESAVITDFDWTSMEGSIGELVPLQQPDFPENWAEMSPDERQAWIKDFQETEEAQKLLEANQKALEERTVLGFAVRSNGQFTVYDVPQGRYELMAMAEKEVDGKSYLVQASGQFAVGEVDEVDLGTMKVDVLRSLSPGEMAPPIRGKSTDGEPITLSDFRGKHVLLAFGSTKNPVFKTTTRLLKEVFHEPALQDKLQVLTVTVDEDIEQVARFNRDNEVQWPCLNLGEWDQEVLHQYGLTSVPSLWLIDPEGQVVLTGRQFVTEMNKTQYDMPKMLQEAIAGPLNQGAGDQRRP